MHDLLWKKPDHHPPLEFLLLYLDEGLEPQDLEALTKHLSQCEACAADLESMKVGARSFAEFRGKVLPAIPLDPSAAHIRKDAPRDWHGAFSHLVAWIRGPRFRPAWIAGAVSAAVLSYLLFSVATPTRLMASEFLKKAQLSVMEGQSRAQRRLVCQVVRVRRGTSVAQRRIVRGSSSAASEAENSAPAWAAALVGPLTWDDPLDLESFLKWRSSQIVRSEEVADTPDLATLTVRTDASAQIRDASITVRSSDWHIVAKQVDLADGSRVEATEIGYEVRDLPAVVSARRDNNSRTALHSNREVAAPDTVPSREELDEAEIRVRALLLGLGIGLGEEEVPPSVRRRKDCIAVEGVISSADRRSQLQSELAAIPHALDLVADHVPAVLPVARRGGIVRPPADAASAATEAPQLRDALIRRLGSEQAATDFSNRLLDDSGKLFALAVQYHEIAKRYTETEMAALPPTVRKQVWALVRQMETAILERLRAEDQLLSPVLGEQPAPEPVDTGAKWQNRAERVFHFGSEHEHVLSRLFAVTTSRAPEEQSAESNVEQLKRVRAVLKRLVQ